MSKKTILLVTAALLSTGIASSAMARQRGQSRASNMMNQKAQSQGQNKNGLENRLQNMENRIENMCERGGKMIQT